jgi:hypothetical protein
MDLLPNSYTYNIDYNLQSKLKMNLTKDYKQIEIEPIIDITIYKQIEILTHNRLGITGKLKKMNK